MLVFQSSGEIEPGLFWEEFNSHKKKLGRVRGFDGLFLREPTGSVSEFVERHAQESFAAHQRRVRGVFVDYEDGVVQLPSEITERESRELIDGVQESLGFAEVAFGRAEARAMVHALSEVDLAEVLSEVRHAVTVDPDAVATSLRSFLREQKQLLLESGPAGLSGEPGQALISDPGAWPAGMRELFREIGLVPGFEAEAPDSASQAGSRQTVRPLTGPGECCGQLDLRP